MARSRSARACSSASRRRSTPSSSATSSRRSRARWRAAFTDKARVVAEFFGAKVDEVFGAEDGHLAKELQRLFGDGSTAAVQHQLRQVMHEQSARMREDLLRQFSSADGATRWPTSRPPTCARRARRRGARSCSSKGCASRWSRSSSKLQKLQSEREKALEVAAEHARGTAKGRPYEEAVAEAVDAIARGQGDDCDAVGDFRGGGGRKGDVVVDIDGCAGAARGRIVFEAKNSRSGPQGGAGRARGGDGPALGRLRRLGRALRGRAAGARAARCARSAATSCSSSTTPRTARASRWTSRTRSPARAC